jgi:hypothetical protein
MARNVPSPQEIPTLAISSEKVCYLVVKAREFDVKEEDSDPDSGSNAADDGMTDVLEDKADDPVAQELAAFFAALDEDEEIDLVTLAWMGRGDGGLGDWDDLRAEAARAHNPGTAKYLLGLPLLADYLEEALSLLDVSCEDFEFGHL